MSYSIRLFKPVLHPGVNASHVLGDGRRRGLGTRVSRPHCEFGRDGERSSDGSGLDTRGSLSFLTCLSCQRLTKIALF